MKPTNWVYVIGAVIVLSCLLPYTLLSGVQAWYGVFLFWSIMGIVIIVANVMLTADWEDQ